MFELEQRQFSVIRRWATRRTTVDQTLSDHSFHVALYSYQLADIIGWGDGNQRYHMLRHALLHDVEELVTSDLPDTWKRTLDPVAVDQIEQNALSTVYRWLPWTRIDCDDEARAIVSCADALEAALFAALEQNRGNRDFGVVMTAALDRLRAKVNALPCSPDRAATVWQTVSHAISNHQHGSPEAAK